MKTDLASGIIMKEIINRSTQRELYSNINVYFTLKRHILSNSMRNVETMKLLFLNMGMAKTNFI